MIEIPKFTIGTYDPNSMIANERTDFTRRIPSLPEKQQLYDANLPIILGALNTMTKEAKEIEKMNQKIKRK